MKKVTQKQAAFYTLYDAYRRAKALPTAEERIEAFRFLPTFEFVGEIHIPELGVWVLRSYKCPTRFTDLYQENPRLLDRKLITGKSGAKYYGYRFSKDVNEDCIEDKVIKDFYRLIKSRS